MEDHMVKRLSEQLADLSVCANSAEDTAAAAEALDKIAARKEARSAARMAVEKVNQQLFRDNLSDSLNSTRMPTRYPVSRA
jgi:hypothetical protein